MTRQLDSYDPFHLDHAREARLAIGDIFSTLGMDVQNDKAMFFSGMYTLECMRRDGRISVDSLEPKSTYAIQTFLSRKLMHITSVKGELFYSLTPSGQHFFDGEYTSYKTAYFVELTKYETPEHKLQEQFFSYLYAFVCRGHTTSWMPPHITSYTAEQAPFAPFSKGHDTTLPSLGNTLDHIFGRPNNWYNTCLTISDALHATVQEALRGPSEGAEG